MFVSAEIRWFWPKACPPLIFEQYHRNEAPAATKSRTDVYLRLAGQTELGVKQRGNKTGIETKGLVAMCPLPEGHLASSCQVWCKWSAESKVPSEWPQLSVAKTRWLRGFETAWDKAEADAEARQGCRLELTKLETANGDIWWTLGFEASGSLDHVVGHLTSSIGQSGITSEAVRDGHFLSYPAWIEQLHAG